MTPPRAHARRPTPRETARDAFRTSILETAERVFLRSGFHAAKMADIAREAGVAVGTLYNYFASKEEIFQDIFVARSRDLHERIQPALAAPSPLAQLCGVVRTFFEYLERHGALFALFTERGGRAEFDVQRLGGDVCEVEYERFLRMLTDLVQNAQRAGELRRDISAAAIVGSLSGAMNGAIYAWLKRRRRGRLAAVADDLLELFLLGARVSP